MWYMYHRKKYCIQMSYRVLTKNVRTTSTLKVFPWLSGRWSLINTGSSSGFLIIFIHCTRCILEKSHHQYCLNYYKNSLTLYILVVEVTCFTSWPSLSSLTVWSGGCFTFFRSLFDLHCISVKRPRTHNATQSNWIYICLRYWRDT